MSGRGARAQRIARRTSVALRAGAGAITLARLARAAQAVPPVAPTDAAPAPITVVVPARDEARRIGPLLDRVVGAPHVDEVIVVDDESSDDTAAIAGRAGATVVAGAPLPPGWAGKAWALHQGIAAARSEWVVTLDADARPDPRLAAAVVARALRP